MRYIFLFATLLCTFSSQALTFKLSESAYISLLTCTPGDENFNAYGHSAIRVKDTINKLDLVYNYGTFNSRVDNFEWKFARGLVQYSLEIEDYARFYSNYNYYERSIFEQKLNLTEEQKAEIFNFLNQNARGANKYYWYDFIFNNCSSKIRDIMEESTGMEFSREVSDRTFRQMIDHYNHRGEWTDLGIDLLLGAKIDRKAKAYETMFLPDHLMKLFEESELDGEPLVSDTQLILDHGYKFYEEGKWMRIFRPGIVFWGIFLIFFMTKIYTNGKLPPIFSVLYLTILGLAGWFLLFMWVGTAHDATKWNLNILWALPFHFPMAFMLFKKKMPFWAIKYFHITRVILITLLCIWPFFPQEFHISVLPVILTALLAISSNIPLSLRR